MNKDILSKDNSKVLRGLAILTIALHNYLHVLGFSKENEMSFSVENTFHFFEVISWENCLAEIFSFLGWMGVPVFIFLTGYGVAHTSLLYGSKSVDYIRRNYLKLLALLLPAVLFYAGIDIIKGNIWPDLLKRFSYLTLLTNFAYPYLRCAPGVYWYFGLTFQFYLLWAFFGKRMNKRNLLVGSLVFLVGLFGLCSSNRTNILSIYRHCFTGWFFIFALGVWAAQSKVIQKVNTNWWLELIIAIASAFLMLQMNRSLLAWIFVPLIALLFFFMLGKLVLRIKPLYVVFHWIGNISAFIFVCHPIARTFVNTVVTPHVSILFLNVLIYLLFTIVFAFLYKWLNNRLLSKIIK